MDSSPCRGTVMHTARVLKRASVVEGQTLVNEPTFLLPKANSLRVLPARNRALLVSYRAFSRVAMSQIHTKVTLASGTRRTAEGVPPKRGRADGVMLSIACKPRPTLGAEIRNKNLKGVGYSTSSMTIEHTRAIASSDFGCGRRNAVWS